MKLPGAGKKFGVSTIANIVGLAYEVPTVDVLSQVCPFLPLEFTAPMRVHYGCVFAWLHARLHGSCTRCTVARLHGCMFVCTGCKVARLHGSCTGLHGCMVARLWLHARLHGCMVHAPVAWLHGWLVHAPFARCMFARLHRCMVVVTVARFMHWLDGCMVYYCMVVCTIAWFMLWLPSCMVAWLHARLHGSGRVRVHFTLHPRSLRCTGAR
jgi:hypothetical protein